MENLYAKQNLGCVDPMEKPDYSANYNAVCYYCGCDDVMDTAGKSHYPILQTRKPELKISRTKFDAA